MQTSTSKAAETASSLLLSKPTLARRLFDPCDGSKNKPGELPACLIGNWMNSLYCLIRSPSFFSSASSYASSFRCRVTLVPRFRVSPESSSFTWSRHTRHAQFHAQLHAASCSASCCFMLLPAASRCFMLLQTNHDNMAGWQHHNWCMGVLALCKMDPKQQIFCMHASVMQLA